MARTFDIRFARSDGIAALLETPVNTFRWRGAGSLRIDGGRLDIRKKRGLLSLLTRRTHFRLDAADLREVAREGDALRIEFGVPGARRGVLPFWVRDRAEAAEIVRLMPTDRTVESDEPVEIPAAPRRPHSRGVLIAVALVSLLIGVVGTWMIDNGRSNDLPMRSPGSTDSQAVDPTAPAAIEAPVETSETEAPTSAVTVASRASPVRQGSTPDAVSTTSAGQPLVESTTNAGSPAGVSAATPVTAPYIDPDAETRHFMLEALALRSEYIYGRTPLENLEDRWWELSVRLYNSPAFDAQPRNMLVLAELGLSLNWRVSLANYRAALASENRDRIEAARADLARADELTDEIGFGLR